MRKLDIKTGDRYNRWTIVKEVQGNRRTFECQCDCGTIKNVRLYSLINNISKSCGCLISETQKKIRTTHGRYGTREYKSWQSMKERCYNPKNIKWNVYGGRGIKVCDEWLNSFENFYNDMGERPLGTTLNRLDNNKGYELSNCEWATIKEQNMNRRNVRHKSN